MWITYPHTHTHTNSVIQFEEAKKKKERKKGIKLKINLSCEWKEHSLNLVCKLVCAQCLYKKWSKKWKLNFNKIKWNVQNLWYLRGKRNGKRKSFSSFVKNFANNFWNIVEKCLRSFWTRWGSTSNTFCYLKLPWDF